MHRFPPLALFLLVAACAGQPRPAAGPVPSEISAAPDSVVDSLIDAEIDAELAAAADSVADADALEELASAHPDGGTEDGLAAVTWDIDVTSFTDHDRVQYYLDYFTGTGRQAMAVWLTRLPRYEAMIRDRLAEQGLPGDLVYLALIESGFSNRAVSRARAVGMWQFMAPTGRGYGLRIDGWVDDRRDPVKSTAAAARHLKDLRERFGSLYLAAAAYNAGAGRVGRGLSALGTDDDADSLYSDATFFRLYDTRLIHRETKDYVPKLIAAAIIAKEPAKYGFTVGNPDEPFRADSVVVPDMTGLDVIARLADTTVAVIRDLNPHYLRLVTPPNTRSIVRVPSGRGDETQEAFDVLPERERVTFREHVVTSGQTASGIAERYSVSLTLLYEANPSIRNRYLKIGQRLVIPVGGAMSTVVARSVSEPAPARAVTWHRIRSGETLSGIAERYRVSQSSLRKWNRMGNSSRIRAGQRLRVGESSTERARAAASGRTHTVRSGETLSGLAQQYGVSTRALGSANGLSASAGIRIGQRLRIPG